MSGGAELHVRHVHEMHVWVMEQQQALTELKLLIQMHHGGRALIRMEAAAEVPALEGRRALSKV